jgi:hypothetical protein
VNIDLSHIDIASRIEAQFLPPEKILELRQVAQIISQRMRRNIPLVAQVICVLVNQFFHEVFPAN